MEGALLGSEYKLNAPWSMIGRRRTATLGKMWWYMRGSARTHERRLRLDPQCVRMTDHPNVFPGFSVRLGTGTLQVKFRPLWAQHPPLCTLGLRAVSQLWSTPSARSA